MKQFIFISIFFALSIAKLSAQFVGSYSLKDGGHVAVNSELWVLPNNQFVILYINGMISGKWIEISKNKIQLKEIKSNEAFTIYATVGNDKTNMHLQFDNFEHANASVSFISDTLRMPNYKPIFNEHPNCIDYPNITSKKINTFSQIKLVYPEIAPYQYTEQIKYPYSAVVYTFQLLKQFSEYRIVFNNRAMVDNMIFENEKKEEGYIVEQKQGERFRGDKNAITVERNELPEKTFQIINMFQI